VRTTKRDPVREAEKNLFEAAFRLAFAAGAEGHYVSRVKEAAQALLRASFAVRRRRPRAKAKKKKKATPKLRSIAGGGR
jgi:hypothetical protein